MLGEGVTLTVNVHWDKSLLAPLFVKMFSLFRVVIYLSLSVCCLPMLTGCANSPVRKPWMNTIRHELGHLGARNWVVIAEAAFPIQSLQGIKVIQLDADIPEVLDGLEDVIAENHYVKPRVYVAAELESVPDDYAPGVNAYKKSFKEALHGRETVSLDHQMLMRLLADTGKSYRVLVIKTRTAMPYSTVFVELGSGYWDAESEAALRTNMEKKR